MLTLLLWTWALSASHATQVRYEQLPCPLDPDDTVRVYAPLAANTQGGFDSDLAQYSSGGQFRTHAVATCAQSLFSLRGEDMAAPLPPDQVGALRDALREEVAALPDPSHPAVWERYRIAARMHQILGAPPLEIAELYLQASWTARDTVVGFHRGLEGPGAVRHVLAQGAVELDKPLTTEQRRTVLYSLARVAHRGGYAALREEHLRRFEAIQPLTPQERETLDHFRYVASVIEPHYQDQAIAWLRKGLQDEGLEDGERVQATYLLADLLRRRGQGAEAQGLYQEVAAHPSAPDLLRGMASSLLEEVGG